MTTEKAAAYHGIPVEQEFGYAQAIKTGDTVYISGQVSIDPSNQDHIIGVGDMATQIRQAYSNIQKVLAYYGLAADNIVDEVIYVTDIDAFAETGFQGRQNMFKGAAVLATTVVQVQRLWRPELMIEIKCVAKVGH